MTMFAVILTGLAQRLVGRQSLPTRLATALAGVFQRAVDEKDTATLARHLRTLADGLESGEFERQQAERARP